MDRLLLGSREAVAVATRILACILRLGAENADFVSLLSDLDRVDCVGFAVATSPRVQRRLQLFSRLSEPTAPQFEFGTGSPFVLVVGSA